jgi:hypothetical protein
MDSERYSDFNAPRTERDLVERTYDQKRESVFHKEMKEGLGNIFKKLEEVDGSIGKRLQDFLAFFVSAKSEEPKKIKEPIADEVPVQSGGSLDQLVVNEINQLLSDVQALQKEVTESEQNTGEEASSRAGVQSDGGCKCESDYEGKFSVMQCEIDVLKKEMLYLSENMSHLLKYLNAKATMKLKGGMEDGRVVFRAEPR